MPTIRLDFATLLVALSAFTGLVWALDRWLFAPARRARNPDARDPVLIEYCRSFFPVIFIVLLLRSFLAEPFRIPSSSMMPTLLIGDFILVNKFTYGLRMPVVNWEFVDFGEPERGDVVVFRYPGRGPGDRNAGTDYIKRVIGVPGDVVEYRRKVLTVNGRPIQHAPIGPYRIGGAGANMTGAMLLTEKLPEVEHQILQWPVGVGTSTRDGRWVVPAGHYFVLGDNRDHSEDSRAWGFVPEENLVGKAFLVWMNWDGKNGGVDFSRIGTLIE